MNLPRHHPPSKLLVDYSTGQVDVPRRFLIECHLELCSECRANLDGMQGVAVDWLESVPEVAPSPAVWESLSQTIEAPRQLTDGGLPLPSQRVAGSLPWQGTPRWRSPLARGTEVAVLARDGDCFLIAARASANRWFPAHEHVGLEETLVLEGGYRDETDVVELGDFVAYEAGSHHRPFTDPDEGCILIARIENGIRFLGWRGWLQRLQRRSLW